ncbi:hypothetical protein Tco_0300901 [Tanacetum coccineum]
MKKTEYNEFDEEVAIVAGKPVTILEASIREDEGEASKRPFASQSIPSPPHLSEDQPQIQNDPSPRLSPSIAIPDSNPEVIAQAKEIKALKAQVKKLKKGVKPLITHHKAWMKIVALKTRLARKTSLKKKGVQKEESATRTVTSTPTPDNMLDQQSHRMYSISGESGSEEIDASEDLKLAICCRRMSREQEGHGVQDLMLITRYLHERLQEDERELLYTLEQRMKKMIKEMNEQAADASKKRVKKDDSVKREIKEEEGTRKRKLGKRKKMKSKKRKFTSKDDEELRLCLTIVPDEDKEVDYEILDKKYPIIEWRSEYLTTKPQYDETEEVENVYLNVVIRSNRQRRYFSTLMAVLSILDRDDICAIYQLVMNKYQDETLEGFDKILWGDLIIMFNQSDSDEFWNAQQNWKIVSWKLHSSSGIHTIMTDEGLFIHMFVENKYHLKKKVLSQLIELKLETKEDSTMALKLIRFIKKHIAELEPKDSDGDEEDP